MPAGPGRLQPKQQLPEPENGGIRRVNVQIQRLSSYRTSIYTQLRELGASHALLKIVFLLQLNVA